MRHRNHRNKCMGYTENQDLLWNALITTCKNNIFTYQNGSKFFIVITVNQEIKVALTQNLPVHNCKIYETFL